MIKIHLSKILGERKWSQADLARRAGIRPTTINEWYHEIIDRINVDHLDRICEVLNCDLCDLLEYIPNPQPRTGRNLLLEEHGNRKKSADKNLDKP